MEIIQISNFRNGLLEAYSSNGTGRLFTYKPFWSHFIPLFIVGFLCFYFIQKSMDNEDYVFYIFISGMAFLFMLLLFLRVLVVYIKWRRTVLQFIKAYDKFDTSNLVLNEKNFELTSGSISKIEKWDDIKQITIEETHVSFLNSSGDAYLIPSKSMSKESFEILVKTIREKVV